MIPQEADQTHIEYGFPVHVAWSSVAAPQIWRDLTWQVTQSALWGAICKFII